MNYQVSPVKKRIFFRVDGDDGQKVGMGHIIRMSNLYKNLPKKLKKNYEIFFLMREYGEGRNYVKKNLGVKIISYNNDFLKKFILKENDIFLFDTLGAEKKLIKKISQRKIKKVISFDETQNLNFDKVLIFNGIFFLKKKLKPKKNINLNEGLKYLILNKNYKKVKLNKNKNILVSSGGSDKFHMLYKIVKILENIDFFNKVYVIIGPGIKKNNKIFKLKTNQKFKYIYNPDNLKKYFDKVEYSLVSGGNVMFESIFSKKKTLVIKLYDNQKYAIKFFKKKGAIKYLGNLKNLSITKIKMYLYTNKKFEFNSLKFDGYGLKRISKKISRFLMSK